MDTYLQPSDWLKNEFESRRARNPHYTLRSFANLMDIPSGRLSEYLSKKRRVTASAAEKMVQSLGLEGQERQSFLDSVDAGRRPKKTEKPKHFIDSDELRVIVDWYHFAILSLMKTEDFKSDSEWIARRLGIREPEAEEALNRLSHLGYIKLQRGKWKLLVRGSTTSHEIPSQAIRENHRQRLLKAVSCLSDCPPSTRDVTSMTISTTPEKMEEAKKLIKEFRRKLTDFLTNGKKTEVYDLNIQLVPISKRERNQ